MSRRVLAIVGNKGPFPRLVDALARVARTTGWQIRVQHASAGLPPGLDGWRLIPRHELMAELDAADAVVCHAGAGTIRDALVHGHRPILVPRLARFGEHVNDHQLELVNALGERAVAIVGEEGDELVRSLTDAIDQARRSDVPFESGAELTAAIRREVEAIARERPARRLSLVYWVLRRIP